MGDSPYEFDRGRKTKDFPLFLKESRFTDDTVMCIAGAMAEGFYGVPEELKQECQAGLPDDLRDALARFAER